MAERPHPRSIAVSALIALHSDPDSPLHDIDFNPHGQDGLTAFLEESVFSSRALNAPLQHWLQEVKERTGQEVAMLLIETLVMASESVDSLVDLMESLRAAISEGLVDPLGAHGIFLRQISLGFEELSFESVTLLWRDLSDQLSGMGGVESQYGQHATRSREESWPLSTTQMERVLTQSCIDTGWGGFEKQESFEPLELKIRDMLASDSELPTAYFLRFLNCLKHGERVGAHTALHQYFDHAMVHHSAPKDILQYSTILLAMAHSIFGDPGLALAATEEAVRVAQQSKDASCVAFALGWLFENHGHGIAERRELLRRCSTRASQGQIRSLVAGSNLTLAKHSLDQDRRSPALAWRRLMDVTSEPASDNLANFDRPTFMTQLPNEALEHQSRQYLVSAGVWDAFGVPSLSGLSSQVALNCSGYLSTTDAVTAIQNVSRLALYGTPSAAVCRESNQNQVKEDGLLRCVYARALSVMCNLRERFGANISKFDSAVVQHSTLLLHEWALNRGDIADARALGTVLESLLHPGLHNFETYSVDVRMQICLRLGREHNWEAARLHAKDLCSDCERLGLVSRHGRALLQLSLIELDSDPDRFMSSLPPLLDALSLCQDHEMHGLQAAALCTLGKVFVRLKNPKRALGLIKAALPSLTQREHIWFQTDASLTLAKCHLQLANSSRSANVKNKRLSKALVGLCRCEKLCQECQNVHYLQEVLYLKAVVYNLQGDKQNRNKAASSFAAVSTKLEASRTSLEVLQLLKGGKDMRHLIVRSW